MTDAKAVLLSLPVVAVALGALAVGLVELGRVWSLGEDSLLLLVVPIALAGIYISWYRALPYEPRGRPSTDTSLEASAVGRDEPFEDPVEEADRLDHEGGRIAPGTEAPRIVDDDAADDASTPP